MRKYSIVMWLSKSLINDRFLFLDKITIQKASLMRINNLIDPETVTKKYNK